MVYTNKKLISCFPNVRTRNLIACAKFKQHSTRYQLLKKAVKTVLTSHCEGQNIPTTYCPTDDELEEKIHSITIEEDRQEPEQQQCEAIHEPLNTFKEDNINLLIAYTLHGCNLSSTCEKKIYHLMQVLTMKQQELPSYRQYKNYIDNLCPINAYKFKYCYDHDNFEAESQLCCDIENKGNLVVFSLLDSVTNLIERNYTYISCPSDHGANSFINSQTYQDLWGDFNEGLRVTLIISIDDASMVKSNKVCTTPVAFTCAELPQYRRICKENIYNLGIFMGNHKINVNTLLRQVLLEPLKALGVITSTCTDEPCYSQEPVILDTRYGVKNVYIKIGMIVTDSVEKYKVLNHKAFNGEYGCPYCCQRGESSQTDKGTRTFVYSYDGPTTLKDHAFYVRNGSIAERDGIVRFGIKGKTNISSIVNLPLQVPIDYMHSILEGNFKFLMSLEPFNNISIIKVVDEYISFIKLPHDSSRRFRSLSDIKYWKASEARTFLFYLIPILRDLVDPDAFILLCLLSVLTRTLCSHESCIIDLHLIKGATKIFLESFQTIYGIAKMRFNVHLMSHIMDQFRLLGSLVEASSFVFENNIYNLKRSFHGTRGQLDQMCKAYLRAKSFVECNEEILPNFMHYDPLSTLKRNIRNNTNIASQVLGNPDTNFQCNDRIVTLLAINHGIELDSIVVYHQFKKNHQVYHSEGYKYRRGSCSYAVSYKHEFNLFYAIVKFFLRSHQASHEIYAVVNDLQVLDSQLICRSGIQPTVMQLRSLLVKNTINSFFKKARVSSILKLIKAETICNKIVLVPVAATAKNSSQSFWLSECNITIDHD